MDSLHLEAVVVTPPGTPLGGRVAIDVHDDGNYEAHFRMHSSSIFGSFDFNVRAYVSAPGFPTMAFLHSGHVGGVDTDDYRENGHNELLRVFWPRLKADPRFEAAKDYSWSGVIGTVADLFDDLIELFAGAAGAALGVVIGATKEAIGLLGATLGPGATIGVVAGTLVFAVTAGTGVALGLAVTASAVVAVVACVVVGLTTQMRPLDDGEKALARQIFGDTVPVDDVILTNIGGAGGRGFTAQGVDGKIYVNLGMSFDAPLGPGGPTYPFPGQLLIHELTHAWQIANTGFLPALMCSMLVTQADNTLGDNAYEYGEPGPAWDNFNPEQQAAIVDQWFAGTGNSSGYEPMDQQNVYFRYVWDNVLHHAPTPTALANVRAAAAGPITGLSRTTLDPPSSPTGKAHRTDRVDVFWAAGDGTVARQRWNDDTMSGWGVTPPMPAAAAGSTTVGAQPIAVARQPNHIDLFWIAGDGTVHTAGWPGPDSAPGPVVQVPISAGTAAVSLSPLAAVSRSPHHLDVFWIAPDGALTTTWWHEPTVDWSTHSPVAVTRSGAVQACSGLAVVARIPVHLDVFWIGPDGAIWTTWWDEVASNGGWDQHLPVPITPPGAARLGSPIAAVARIPEHIDVFWIAPDGSIVTHWWDATPHLSWGDHPPFAITAPGSASTASGLAAVARTQLHLDVFWVGPTGAVESHWWDATPGRSWPDHLGTRIAEPGTAHTGSPLAAVSHNSRHIDVFFVAPDGAATLQWWDTGTGGGWDQHPTQAISPPGALARDYATGQHAAGHLVQRSAELANIGDTAAAIDAQRQAVDVLNRVTVQPAEQRQYFEQLADALLGLVVRLVSGPPAQITGITPDAINACQQAVSSGTDPILMANKLQTLSVWASNANATEAAVLAAAAAVAMLRGFSPPSDRSREYHRALALALFDLFTRQVTAGHLSSKAAPAIDCAAELQRSVDAGAARTECVGILLTLSVRTAQAGLADPAVTAAQVAVDILRAGGAATGPSNERAFLAAALRTLATRQVAAGHSELAGASAREAVQLYQTISEEDPGIAAALAEAEAFAATLP